MLHMLRDDLFAGARAEFFQVSRGLEIEYDQATHSFIRFDYEGEPIDENRLFSVGVQHYFYDNLGYAFDLALDDLKANRQDRTVTTSCNDVVEEALLSGEYLDAQGAGRIVAHLQDARQA
jgi:5'-nucleotidase